MFVVQSTITLYLARLFLKQFFITCLAILSILFIASTFDILQKFKSDILTLHEFWLLTIFKIPYLFNETSVLLSFIATILFLQFIRKNNELIVILSNGIPIWRVFSIPVIMSCFLGVSILVFVTPIGSYGMKKYEKLESKITGNTSDITVSPYGIFFYEKFDNKNIISQAKSINIKTKTAYSMTILIVDEQNNLLERIDADSVGFDSGFLKLSNVVITDSNSEKKIDNLNMPTHLSIEDIVVRFNSPQVLNLLELKSAISAFEKSGLSVIKYKIYYFKEILKPLTMIAMSFTACWFVSLNLRGTSNLRMLIFNLVLGLCVYFMLELSFRVLAYSGISIFFAILLPIIFVILISNFVILHFQAQAS